MLKTIVLLLVCTFTLSVRQMAVSDRGLKISNDNMLGNYLTDSNGMSLYVFDQDDNNMSSCYANCTQLWKPFTVDAGITVFGNITTSMLGMFARNDGPNQLTFGQMPLYFYKLDMMAGDKNGQGIMSNRGYWYLVAPDGTPIMNMMNNTATPADSSMSTGNTDSTLPDASNLPAAADNTNSTLPDDTNPLLPDATTPAVPTDASMPAPSAPMPSWDDSLQ